SSVGRVSGMVSRSLPGLTLRQAERSAARSPLGRRAARSLLGEPPDLPLDLRGDVQRRLALAGAPVVASDDQVPDLGPELVIDERRGQAAELGLDVELRFAAPSPAGVAGPPPPAGSLVPLA